VESRQVAAEAKKIAKLEQRQILLKEKENEVEVLNVENTPIVTSQHVDKARDKKEGQNDMDIKKAISREEENLLAPSMVTRGC